MEKIVIKLLVGMSLFCSFNSKIYAGWLLDSSTYSVYLRAQIGSRPAKSENGTYACNNTKGYFLKASDAVADNEVFAISRYSDDASGGEPKFKGLNASDAIFSARGTLYVYASSIIKTVNGGICANGGNDSYNLQVKLCFSVPPGPGCDFKWILEPYFYQIPYISGDQFHYRGGKVTFRINRLDRRGAVYTPTAEEGKVGRGIWLIPPGDYVATIAATAYSSIINPYNLTPAEGFGCQSLQESRMTYSFDVSPTTWRLGK